MQHGMGMTRQDEPFASRESALRALTALLDDDAPRRVAVVEGPPGIGKSRLLRDWARLAAASGREVHGAYGALAYRTVPYGMLLDAVQETGAAEVLARASADHPDDRATRHRTHLRVAKAVRAALAAPKAAVVLDDVQWSDTESLAVLERLVRMPGHAGAPVFVLAYRQGECPDGLARTLSSANAQHLPLPPLDEAETARMLPGTSPATAPCWPGSAGATPGTCGCCRDCPRTGWPSSRKAIRTTEAGPEPGSGANPPGRCSAARCAGRATPPRSAGSSTGCRGRRSKSSPRPRCSVPR